jgi:2-polyprenyl-6-methoxyphenol hydroxylase-like FAD-dependent oxidoreductase
MADAFPGQVGVAVAGGSIAGLCAGNALLAAGHDVHVFERSATRLTSRGAGIVVQPDLASLLKRAGTPPLAMTHCTTRKNFSGRGGPAQLLHMPQQFTSWEAIFASLSGAFPAERYHAGMELEIAEATANGVTLRANRETLTADLLIAADGFRSETRARFAPETISRYAGYIAWRGVADETDLPDTLVAFFDDNFCFCDVGDGGHALCYLIPGEGGSTARGTRRLNWVWYVTVPEGESLNAVMTDGAGRQRHASVPVGHVNATALNDLHRRAESLERHFADLVRATPEPFIQSILDVAPPEMVFGRICLLGDAAFVVRPHTAAATAKAAAEASALAASLKDFAPNIDQGLAVWNRQQVSSGRRLVDYGVMLGERTTRRKST